MERKGRKRGEEWYAEVNIEVCECEVAESLTFTLFEKRIFGTSPLYHTPVNLANSLGHNSAILSEIP